MPKKKESSSAESGEQMGTIYQPLCVPQMGCFLKEHNGAQAIG